MNIPGAFWYLLGALSGIAAVFILIPLFRDSALPAYRRVLVMLAAALLPAIAAFLFYRQTGSPQLSGQPVQAVIAATAHGTGESAETAQSGSIEEAVARVEARVAAGQGSEADWSLLAQSYDFLGRTQDAERARSHLSGGATPAATGAAVAAVPADASTALNRAEQTAAQYEEAVRRAPRDAASWFGLAQARRVARDFSKANEAYAKALALDPQNADAWADYADSLASGGNRQLAGKPAQAIQRALALQPNHVKGLWLSASLALEQRQYGEALKQWQRLRGVLPAGSPDLAIIEGNITEARELAGQPAAPVAPVAAAASGTAIEGSVDLDPALRLQVQPGMTLFIYAKTPDGKGPPLAALRVSAGQWPVKFRLDDSQAMMPGRNLSSVERVLVEARLSRSGNAIAEKGDLLAVGQVVPTRGGKPVPLKISKAVG